MHCPLLSGLRETTAEGVDSETETSSVSPWRLHLQEGVFVDDSHPQLPKCVCVTPCGWWIC